MSDTSTFLTPDHAASAAVAGVPDLGSGPAFRRPRLGFAGVGWIGRNRLQAIAEAGAGDVSAVYDPVAEAVDLVVSVHPQARSVGRFEDLLGLELDGIVIATPSALHAEQAIAALSAGLPVFCQKPLARSAAETRAVIAAAQAADRLLGVDLSYRHTAGMKAIRDLIQRGDLGEIYAIETVFHNAYGPDKAWFYSKRAAGGGCLLDLGIHLVDLALWSLGFPEVQAAHGVVRYHDRAPFSNGEAVEDYATGQLELDGGAVVQLACSWRVPAGCEARIEFTAFGTHGGACFRNLNGSFFDFTAEHFLPDRTRRVLAQPPDAWGGRAAVTWATQLATRSAFDPEIESVASVADTLDRLYGC